MLQLFLSEPSWGRDNGNEDESLWIKNLLDDLEAIIWSLMSSGGLSEARLWLCISLSSIQSISIYHQRELFLSLLRSKPTKQHLASQLIQCIFEMRPKKAGSVIAKKSHKLENFFKGNPRRILQWFSNFSGSGNLEHGKGAKALSRFAFVNRDICWEELEWKGKHGQSPAMVATKPHYFLDLDVQRTVENFIEYVPEFWSSHEFSESLKDGDILLVDPRFFVDMFIDLMYDEEMREVWKIVEDFLKEESFSFLCHRLLIVLEEPELRLFLNLILKYLKPKPESFGFDYTSNWFEIVLSKYTGSTSFNQLLLLNAVATQGRQLLRLMKEEGDEEQKNKINNCCFQLCESSEHGNNLALLMEEGFKRKPLEFIKWLGLLSFAIQFRLSEEFHSLEFWESLFIRSGIRFRRSNKYALLHDEESEEDCGSDWGKRSSLSLRRKAGKKQRKKRRLVLDHGESYENETPDFNFSNTTLDLQSKVGDWLLSTDEYATAWSSMDLPGHLSKHCFLTWLKWAFAKWKL